MLYSSIGALMVGVVYVFILVLVLVSVAAMLFGAFIHSCTLMRAGLKGVLVLISIFKYFATMDDDWLFVIELEETEDHIRRTL